MSAVARRRLRQRGCGKPDHEIILNTILGGLLASDIAIGTGSIVDAGAYTGESACYFASRAPNRTVHALDPSRANVNVIAGWRDEYRNIQPMVGALGREAATVEAKAGGDKRGGYTTLKQLQRRKTATASTRNAIHIYRLDDLFGGDEAPGAAWHGERFALGHLDVEGAEAAVLEGGRRVIERDHPILTVEAHVHRYPNKTRVLMEVVESLGYDAYIVEEICGMRADCRNMLLIPRARMRFLTRGRSDVLDLAVASRVLIAVNASTIGSFAFPCCRAGGECCPRHLRGGFCCSHGMVDAWLGKRVNASYGDELQYFTRTRWYDQHHRVFRSADWLRDVQALDLSRARANKAGLTLDSQVWYANLQAHMRRRGLGGG